MKRKSSGIIFLGSGMQGVWLKLASQTGSAAVVHIPHLMKVSSYKNDCSRGLRDDIPEHSLLYCEKAGYILVAESPAKIKKLQNILSHGLLGAFT